MTVRFTPKEMGAYLDEVFPQMQGRFTVLAISETECEMRAAIRESDLRPGNTVAGPTMFALADVTAYVMTMARIGPEALTVTTGCSMDFMRKPSADAPLTAKAKLLKLGRSLSVTDVLIYSGSAPDPVARATMTYSIPPATPKG